MCEHKKNVKNSVLEKYYDENLIHMCVNSLWGIINDCITAERDYGKWMMKCHVYGQIEDEPPTYWD